MAYKEVDVIIKNTISENGDWVIKNPILENGHIGIDSTNWIFKIGDGETAWNDINKTFRTYEEVVEYLNTVSSTFIIISEILPINERPKLWYQIM